MSNDWNQDDPEAPRPAFNMSRRDFLRYLGLLAGAGSIPGAVLGCGSPSASRNLIFGTPTPLPTVANPGERIPDLQAVYSSHVSYAAEMWRKIALDGEKVGFKYKLNQVSQSAWLNTFYTHTHGDLLSHGNESMPYRDSDPTEHLVARLHSREATPPQRNIGEYKNPEADKLAESVESELDNKKRLQAAYDLQELNAKDYYYWAACTGPNPINAYNGDEWENVTSSTGNSLAGTAYVWNWMTVRSKTGKKRVVYGVPSLDTLNLTNPFGPGGTRGTNQLYFDKFLQLDPNLKIIPWVITEWKMTDQLTWEFTIRDGIKWHDGRPATAEDVAFTFNYYVKWKPSFFTVIFEVVNSAEVINNRQVRVKLKKPSANMVSDLLIRGAIMPKHIWENVVERQNVKDPSAVKITDDMMIGTGPFKWGHLAPDVELLLTANRNHWKAPNVEELLMTVVPSLDAMLGKLENKEIDFQSEFLTPTQASRLKPYKHIRIDEAPRSLSPFIVPFFARLPWRDPVFRKAWHRTVDKDYLVKVIWEGAGSVLPFNALMGPNHPFHNPDIKERFNYNLDEARKILAAGGYSWDKEGRLLYPSPDNADYKRRSQRALV